MKDSFDRFAVRYLTAVLGGLLLLLLHGAVQGGLFAVFVPQYGSAWELSKLAFWPMLVSCLVTGRLGRERRPLARDLPAVVLVPLALTLADWAVLALGGSGGVCLALWVALVALGLAFGPDGGGRRAVWAVLAAALAGFYILLTYLPLLWGPFLDPTDVAAMATIPF